MLFLLSTILAGTFSQTLDFLRRLAKLMGSLDTGFIIYYQQFLLTNIYTQNYQQKRSMELENNRQYDKQEVLNLRRQNQEVKRMFLSEQIRQALSKMQRFDKLTYSIHSEKILKGPISNEVRRLQKMKNEFVQMRSKLYDNQLTIICISNHVKMISEMSKQLQQIVLMKSKTGELQKKISEMTMNHRKQIAQYKKKIMLLDMNQNKNKRIMSSPNIIQESPSKTSKQQVPLTPYARLKSSKSSLDDSKENQNKQLQNFKQFYEILKEKMGQNISYEKQLNQLKNLYASSPLIELLQSKISLENTQKLILNNLQQMSILFSQNGLKRHQNKVIKQQGEIFQCINKISSSIINLINDNKKLYKSQNQLDALRKKYIILNDENQEIKLSLKEFQKQLVKKNSNYKKNGDAYNSKNQSLKLIQIDFLELDKANQKIGQQNIEITKLRQQSQKIKFERLQYQQTNLTYNKVLYQKVKAQRDNLKLLLQEKSEQYEMSKQNEEKYEQLKKKDDQIINELKQSFKKIDEENNKLINQLKQTKNYKQISINQRLEQEVKKNEILLQRLQQLKTIQALYKTSQQNFEKQRQIFRQQLVYFHQLSQESSATLETDKKQKLQLHLKLYQLNQELSAQVRNTQNQKRQTRKYIQQLLKEIQNKDMQFNQQKTLLKEDIERARCEQYEINQIKINKLIQEIQAMRVQNDKLMQIIETNQAPFNQLVSQHKIMCEQINRLLSESKQLTTIIKSLQTKVEQMTKQKDQKQKQKINLQFQLNQLREKISNDEKKIKELQSFNDELNYRYVQSQRNIIKLNSRLITSELQIKTQEQYFSKAQLLIQSRQGEYQRYLQEKNKQYEEQINILRQKEQQFPGKFEKIQQQVKQLKSQKEKMMYLINLKDYQIVSEKQKGQKDIINLKIQINNLQREIASKNVQIKTLEEESNHKKNLNQIFQAWKNKQIFMHKLSEQNNKLRLIIQESNRGLAQFENIIEQNKRIVLQNKRLNHKLSLTSVQFEQIRKKYIQSQQKNIEFQCKIMEISSNSVQLLTKQSINLNQKLEKQASYIYYQQLKQKDNQILQIRRLNYGLQTKFNQMQRKMADYEVKQEQYKIAMVNYQQIKLKLRKKENELIRFENQKKFDLQSRNRQLEQKKQIIKNLKHQIASLTQDQNKLIAQHSSFRLSQKQLLLQIINKFDQNYKLYEQQQHIKDLRRISKQVSQLIEINQKLQQRCEESSRSDYQIYIEQVQTNNAVMLRQVIDDFIDYLTIKKYLNPEQISTISKYTNISKFIWQLSPFLKNLFQTYSKRTQSEIQKYNNVIRDMRILIQQAQVSNNFDALKKLVLILKQSD